MIPDNIVHSLDDKDEFTKFKIRVVCGWCKKELGFTPTNDPKQHGKISHGMCAECEREQYRQLGMEPPIREALDDVDEFHQLECWCSAGEYGAPPGPGHVDFCPLYSEPELEDEDEFEPASYCGRCDEPFGEDELFSANDAYDPRDATMVCKSCLDILNQGPQNDKWLEESILESLEDADEFGPVKVVECYEESGPDYVKLLFIFEDETRLYWMSQTYKDYDGSSKWTNTTKVRLPNGQTQKFSYDPEITVPEWAMPYIESMDQYSQSGERKPFPQHLLKEYNHVMAINEDLDDKDEFSPQWATPVNVSGHAYGGPNREEAYLIYDFADGARVYYMARIIDDRSKFVLRANGTTQVVPNFKSSTDAPDWFSPYYNGMMVAGVSEKKGKGVWMRGPIQPFTPGQRREWAQIMGQAPVDEGFNRRIDEAFKPPTLAEMLNTRGVKPEPSDLNKKSDSQIVPDALDDRDEFADKRGSCVMPEGGISLLDSDGNDVTDQLQRGFREMMSIWVDHSPNWLEHKNFEEFTGQLSTRPPLLGPECVVWVDAPVVNQPAGPKYGHGTPLPPTHTKAAWYHPERGLWIDE